MNPKKRWTQCYYLSSTSNIAERYLDCFGMMESLTATGRGLAGLHPIMLDSERPWALDNGVFTDSFEPDKFSSKLDAVRKWIDTCAFVVCPDVIGDYQATLDRFSRFAPWLRSLGFPVGFATQDGLTIEQTPWGKFDALFVGGTDQHKLGPEAGALIAEGIRRGKWIHIGRVNSPKRMRQFWRANSWDGTTLSKEPGKASKIAAAVREIRVWQQTRRLI